ncbi:MAG: RecQ family ATP-dependent DNA helicase [Paludibacteraceae bacterium]|nr:RecQ family ATP-dependent DNA helicase [Paludibacteraceae bacterium]
MSNSEKYHSVLQKYWGYSSFRPLQEDIIDAAYRGLDVLGLMPTGGGKSITFQVPALCKEGTCLVITPLIALMKDQVDNLRDKGIRALTVYSGMSHNEILQAYDNCILGDYKFLYISPERLATELFLEKVRRMNVSMLVVDESHCISQWGYDFRPSYLKIAEIRSVLPPDVPVLALTATATPEVVEDIQNQLKFRQHLVYKKSFARKNIAYVVRKTDDKVGQMLHILNSVPGTSIVYVRNRKKTKEVADLLRNEGFSADHFHAGLSQESKDKKQEAWKSGECRVIVATNAFGMGIDKPDVRTVIHLDLPDTLEAYFQEAGRAGRDEKKAYAILLYNNSDISKLKKRVSDNFPERDFIVQVYRKLSCYFEIGVDEGAGFMHSFSLMDFCTVFKLPMLQTFSALKILQQAGYVELTDEINQQSKVMFVMTKEELYHQSLDYDPKLDEIINLLLRSYTGLFAEYALIDEVMMSHRLELTRDELYHKLSALSKLGIISYIPGKKSPYIIYSRRRVDDKYVKIGRDVYETRLERFQERIQKVIAYVMDEEHCRSRMLLQYFGEMKSSNCGMCDFCLAKKDEGVSNHEYERLRELVQSLLKSGPVEYRTMISSMACEESHAVYVLRYMQDEREIELTDEGFYRLNH